MSDRELLPQKQSGYPEDSSKVLHQQHQAESALLESEARLRLAVEGARLGTWDWNLRTQTGTWSDRTAEILGVSDGENITPQRRSEVIHPDDRERVWHEFAEAIRSGGHLRSDYRVVWPDGQVRWIESRGAIERDAKGIPTRASGIVLDVTERFTAEARLRERDEQLRLATEAAELGLWDLDVLTNTLFWPPRVKAMFGISADQPATMDDYYNGLHPDDLDATATAFADALDPSKRALYDVEYRTIGKEDGIIRWVAAKGRGVFDETGTCVRVLGTALDITNRRQTENALRESEARVRALTNNLPAGMVYQVVTGSSGAERRFLYVSQSHHALTGIPAEAVLADAAVAYDLIVPEDRQRVAEAEADAISTKAPFDVEVRFRRADGVVLWCRILSAPREQPDGSIIWDGLQIDTTEQKEAESALRESERRLRELNDTLEERIRDRTAELGQAHEQLRQSQKLEAMGALTGGVAHDFNNLLSPIVGSLDLLQRKGLGGEREQRLIDGALQSAERARILVQRLLAFARRQPLQPKPVDIGALVNGMAGLIGSTSGPQVKVVVKVAQSLPAAVADPNQIEMAILNLAVNARDAMPSGGTLTISAESEENEEPGSTHRSQLPKGRYVRLSVADTGTGMSEETLARAVEPFFSTKGIGQGTGLGLSMVHGLASQLGGALTIESKVGLGTVVEIWLPASTDTPADQLSIGSSPVLPSVGVALVVDDEELVRHSTTDMLVDLGYQVLEASSAEDALTIVKGGQHLDLLVTDHLMPGITGTELAREVRALLPSSKVLVVTGYADIEGLAPEFDRLIKPFKQAELAARLSEIG
jgi:PAS domain S-box-containing protein